MSTYDLIVIGGGAAGFFTAIQTAEASLGTARILLLEKASQTLGKVKVSGGGRCNVTHSCFDPKALSKNYPRGEKSLIGPFHHFQPTHMIEWLESCGVELKTEADGRMFPVSDSSQTIIDALTQAATSQGIEIRTSSEVSSIDSGSSSTHPHPHTVTLVSGDSFHAHHLVIATGGTRLKSSSHLAESMGHQLLSPVPSLFTFNINDSRLDDIAGVSVKHVEAFVRGTKFNSTGPILVTHWGLSGPAILKLSAWGARQLSASDYHFELTVNWSPHETFEQVLSEQRTTYGKRTIIKRSPLDTIPRRLWEKLCMHVGIDSSLTWSQLTAQQESALTLQVHACTFKVTGKSLNKEEFVTCGGVPLKEVRTKTFESKLRQQVYFTGEVLDIDGVTGGFNFQNAWTTAYLASQSIAAAILTNA